MKMHDFARDAWLEALRSGEFEQTKGILTEVTHTDLLGNAIGTAHCCLGVLTEVAKAAGVELETAVVKTENTASQVIDVLSYDGDTETLPKAVAEWAGIDVAGDSRGTINNPTVYVDGNPNMREGRFYLSDLNDMWDFNFEQIADAIEAETS